MFFTSLYYGSVDYFRVATGEYLGYTCSAGLISYRGAGLFRPSAFRVTGTPGDEMHYVADAVPGGAILRYPQVCLPDTTEIVFMVANKMVEDFAFGDPNTMFVMTLDQGEASAIFGKTQVYKVDLSVGEGGVNTIGTPVLIGDHDQSMNDFQGARD